MTKWVIGILVSSVVMSLILKLLPENSMKRSVHMTFGIIFLMVTAVPVMNMFSSGVGINEICNRFESDIKAADNSGDEKYARTVISEYSESLCNIAEKKILEETGTDSEVEVLVCADTESSCFGKVLNVKCAVINSENFEKSDKNSVLSDVPLIKDVVIEIGKDKNKSESISDYNDVSAVLSELFGITAEQCEIYTKGGIN